MRFFLKIGGGLLFLGHPVECLIVIDKYVYATCIVAFIFLFCHRQQ